MGVASRSSDCDSPVYTALSPWRDWIREVATRAVRRGGYAAPEWLVAEQLEELDGIPAVEERPGPPGFAEPTPSEQDGSGEDGASADAGAFEHPEGEPSDPSVTSDTGEGAGCSLGPAPAAPSSSWAALLLLGSAAIGLRRQRSRSS
jgi:hypothetical protein